MKTCLECLPCFVRQALESTQLVSNDSALQERVLRSVLAVLAQVDLQQPPPVLGAEIHRIIREVTGEDDPFQALKLHFNQFVEGLLPRLRGLIEEAADPLETGIRLAAAGNVIDFGVRTDLTEEDIWHSIQWSLAAPMDRELLERFRLEVQGARSILYLGDNAGEILCDRLLIEILNPAKVTLAVRARPVINDATHQDAESAGLTDLVRVINNGSDIPGTHLARCSPEFCREFEAADLVIAKGQGNFETLNDTHRRVYFLFKAKCPVIAKSAGCTLGDLVFFHN